MCMAENITMELGFRQNISQIGRVLVFLLAKSYYNRY